jgi:hypothetical protein
VQDQVVELIVESATMELWDLLANIGGTMGLYAGMSLLTLVEITEIIVLLHALVIHKIATFIAGHD